MGFADLHIHSIYSDGNLSPLEIIKSAKEQKLDCISITDHDSVEAYINYNGFKDQDIEIIPAVEITTEYDSKEIHILGYLVDYRNEDFLQRLKLLREKRLLRIEEMIKKLNSLNIDVNFEEILDLYKESSVTRLHLAKHLLKKGYVKSITEAFMKFLGEGAACYVSGFRFSPFEAIKLIRDIKAVPILAHPYNIENLEDILSKFIEAGLKGVEVYYPEHSYTQISYYEGICRKYNLLLTGGSDFHGDCRPEVKIGSIRIPYNLVEKLKNNKRC